MLNAPVEQQGRGGVLSARGLPALSLRRTITNNQAARDVIAVRGVGEGQQATELAETLLAVEGSGNLRTNPIMRAARGNIHKAQKKAYTESNLAEYATKNQEATNKLVEEAGAVFRGTSDGFAVTEAISNLSVENGQVTVEAIIQRAGLQNSKGNQRAIAALLNSEAGLAFREAQAGLDQAMGQFQSKLSTNLYRELEGIGASQRENLVSTINKATTETKGFLGSGGLARGEAENQVLRNIGGLVEARAEILTEGLSLTGQRQASELRRIASEAIKEGNPETLKQLEQALADPAFNFETVGSSSALSKLLDTGKRNLKITLDRGQANKLNEVIKLEGRGRGDVQAAVKEVFSPKAITSPNSPAGRELSQVMGEQGEIGEHLLTMGKREGSGRSAFVKITSGDPAMQDAGAYTLKELEQLGANLTGGNAPLTAEAVLAVGPLTNPANGRAAALFREQVQNGKVTLNQALANINTKLSKAQGKVQGKANPQQGLLDEVAQLEIASAEMRRLYQSQQAQLSGHFGAASRAMASAENIVAKDVRITGVNLPSGVTSPFAAPVAGEAKPLGTMGTVATVGGIGGLAALTAGRGARPVAAAEQEMLQRRQASWGISPLHAPVRINKTAAMMPPIKLKDTLPKLPKPKDIPAQSMMTAPLENRVEAMKQSSYLMAPVRSR
jgi:hypothetical protein